MAEILLIHGAGDSGKVWERQAAHFTPRHRVFAIDLPGHGARLSEDGMSRHEDNATDVRRFLAQQKVSRAVIAGHSMGGAVAMMTALQYPELVSALVLVATGARLRMRPDFLEQAKQSSETYGKTIPPATHIIPVEQMVHPAIPAEVVSWLKERIGGASAQATYADFQANNNFDVMSRLPEIAVPTLVVGGSDDAMAPQKFSEFLAKAIPGAQMEILTPSGHYPMVEQEKEFNKCLESFLAKAVPAAAAV